MENVVPFGAKPKKQDADDGPGKFTRPRASITENIAAAQWHAVLLRRCADGKIPVESMSKLSNCIFIQQKLNDAAWLAKKLEALQQQGKDQAARIAELEAENAQLHAMVRQ